MDKSIVANFFPRTSAFLPFKIVVCLGLTLLGVSAFFNYYASNKTMEVGFTPDQPIPFDHMLHVEQNGIDCRYCHSAVDKSPKAGVPSASTCWNCHQHVAKGNAKLAALRGAMGVDENHVPIKGATPQPIRWVRVHKLPDYVYFDHSAHVNRGVSCQSCHGDVHTMQKIGQQKSLSMAFCLDCHRDPQKALRPLEEVYNLHYDVLDYLNKHPLLARQAGYHKGDTAPIAQRKLGALLQNNWSIHPKESCYACHR